jgi:hypothetical protein
MENNMSQLVASTFIGKGSLSVYLDSKLVIEDSDSATLQLEDACEYIIHWVAVGVDGSPYSITISSPNRAQFQLTKILGESGKDFGGFRFKA